MLLLDTCALLWLAEGGHELSDDASRRIEDAAVVYVSAISAFEIAMKCRSGKLVLPQPPADWFRDVIGHHGLTVQPLDWETCMAAADLPPIHRDPCDRFIIAAARREDLPVITADTRFGAYGIEVIS